MMDTPTHYSKALASLLHCIRCHVKDIHFGSQTALLQQAVNKQLWQANRLPSQTLLYISHLWLNSNSVSLIILSAREKVRKTPTRKLNDLSLYIICELTQWSHSNAQCVRVFTYIYAASSYLNGFSAIMRVKCKLQNAAIISIINHYTTVRFAASTHCHEQDRRLNARSRGMKKVKQPPPERWQIEAIWLLEILQKMAVAVQWWEAAS